LVDQIKYLRSQSRINMNPRQLNAETVTLGRVQRDAAIALEGLLDHGVSNAGEYWKGKVAEADQRTTAATAAFEDANRKLRTASAGARRAELEQKISDAKMELVAAKSAKSEAETEYANFAKSKDEQGTYVDQVKQARQNIAKSYDVEKAVNFQTGEVNANVLAQMQRRNKNLSGGLKKIAEAAEATNGRIFRPTSKVKGLYAHETMEMYDTIHSIADIAKGRLPWRGMRLGIKPLASSRLLGPRPDGTEATMGGAPQSALRALGMQPLTPLVDNNIMPDTNNP
jgi:hypothetical protein